MKGFELDGAEHAEAGVLAAWVAQGLGPFENRRGEQLLKFRLTTDVPGDYEVWWKVRNRGAAAERVGQLRGRIFHHGNLNRNEHRESTRYPGLYYVEAYVVRNGVVGGRRVTLGALVLEH